MNLIEKLNQTIEFSKKYSTLKKATNRTRKNIESMELNQHLISGHNDDIDAIAQYSIISDSTIVSIGLHAISIGLKKLQPITKNQIKKKENLINTFEDLQARYLKINTDYEVEETV